MANLPAAVQRQVEAAEALLSQQQQQAEVAVEEAQPPLETAVEPAQQVEPPAEAQAQEPPPSQPQHDWEHKFKTLQGIFNSEMPKLQQQNKELNARLQEALERMEKLATKQERQEQSVQQKPQVDPKDVDNFGQDLVEMVQRVAQASFAGVAAKVDGYVSGFDSRLKMLEEALQGTTKAVAQTAEQAFFDRLSKMVPDWEAINQDQAFLTWLGSVDPVYGAPRQAALDQAQRAGNVERVAAVFQTFKSTQPQAPKKDVLEKQVSPKAAASAPVAPQGKPVLTQKQVTDFYNDLGKGKYRGRESEAQRLEAIINEAMAEGRIR